MQPGMTIVSLPVEETGAVWHQRCSLANSTGTREMKNIPLLIAEGIGRSPACAHTVDNCTTSTQ